MSPSIFSSADVTKFKVDFGFVNYHIHNTCAFSGEICTVLNVSIDFSGATATPC